MKGQFATRLCGSPDLYEENGRGPCHSINFITAHDGFTLRDLVSYNKKHNHLNNEESGDDQNLSWNCGEPHQEGDCGDVKVLKLRDQQMRNMLLALLLSAGTPMITSGDEYGRSQGGNNNTWCQDELNWFSWANCAKEEESLLRFFRRAICLRKQHGDVLARTEFMTHETIQWNHLNWEDEYNFISFILHRPGEDVQDAEQPEEASVVSAAASKAASSGSTRDSERRQCTALLVAFNAGHLAHECHLPQGRDWFRLVDTSLPAPQDIVDCDEDAQLISGEAYVMTPYSCIILRSFADLADAQRYDTGELEPSHAKQWEEELRQVASQPLESQLLEDDFEEVGSVALSGASDLVAKLPSAKALTQIMGA